MAVSSADSIRAHWDIRGTPTMLIHEKFISNGNSDSLRVLELSLIVEKGKKQSARQVIQVAYRAAESFETISFATAFEGDSMLVAKGIKSVERWSGFEIVKLGSASARPLIVLHEGRKAILNEPGAMYGTMGGTTVSGEWEIRSPLTAAEKTDRNNLPEILELKALVIPKKR